MIQIALIWGNHRKDPQFHTHHSYWEAAIADSGRARYTRYTWDEFPDMPRTYDLYFFVDFSPKLYGLPKLSFKNTAFYWWDSFHFSLAVTLQVADLFDRSYYAEQISAMQARHYGFDVRWLPSAFYEGVYRPLPDRRKVHNYAFLGNPDNTVWRNGDTRASFLSKLASAPGLHGYIGNREVRSHALNEVFNESEVLFDRTIFSIVGTRFFETVGSGGFTLMNRSRCPNGIEYLAVDGVHYASYDDSFADFERKLRYYVARPEERDKIARAGAGHFAKNHTYSHRLGAILADFGLLG